MTSLFEIWNTSFSEILDFLKRHEIKIKTETGAYIRASQKYADLKQLPPQEQELVQNPNFKNTMLETSSLPLKQRLIAGVQKIYQLNQLRNQTNISEEIETLNRTITHLQNQIELAIQDNGKIPMAIVEASNTARKEYNDCVNRQQKLNNDLKVKRSERLSKQVKDTASIINLVQMWKEEESRAKLIKMAEMRKKTLEKEIDRLSSMDEVKCKILGISRDEILNG